MRLSSQGPSDCRPGLGSFVLCVCTSPDDAPPGAVLALRIPPPRALPVALMPPDLVAIVFRRLPRSVEPQGVLPSSP